MKIMLLYGTETGNAEMLAEDIVSELGGEHDVECASLSDVDPGSLEPGTLHLVVCSTYGDGELPASARPFAEKIETGRPSLAGVHFGIFGLGDSEYEETYNEGGRRMADLLTGCGAVQVGDRVAHDASGPDLAEDLALPWARSIVEIGRTKLDEAA